MPTCRNISQAAWEKARQALVFYFSRRHQISNAEDLAQDTLAAILGRDDYEFQKEEDFLRVCYAFAGRISKAGWRREKQYITVELDENSRAAADGSNVRLSSAELGVYLKEVIQAARTELADRDLRLIEDCVRDRPSEVDSESTLDSANRLRVRLHRARKRLASLTGWIQSV